MNWELTNKAIARQDAITDEYMNPENRFHRFYFRCTNQVFNSFEAIIRIKHRKKEYLNLVLVYDMTTWKFGAANIVVKNVMDYDTTARMVQDILKLAQI